MGSAISLDPVTIVEIMDSVAAVPTCNLAVIGISKE